MIEPREAPRALVVLALGALGCAAPDQGARPAPDPRAPAVLAEGVRAHALVGQRVVSLRADRLTASGDSSALELAGDASVRTGTAAGEGAAPPLEARADRIRFDPRDGGVLELTGGVRARLSLPSDADGGGGAGR